MLVMLKELKNGEEKDITINPNEVVSISNKFTNECLVELTTGQRILVKGSIVEITKRLNSNKRSNKNENKTLLQG